ncbi:MAG: transposase [Bdellovibrionales bacterium]|nr:transposase [Bdellovibrionales bacterium]
MHHRFPEAGLNQELRRRIDQNIRLIRFTGSADDGGVAARGYPVNRKRVIRLMAEMGLQAIYPKPAACDARSGLRSTLPAARGDRDGARSGMEYGYHLIHVPGGFVYLAAIRTGTAARSWRGGCSTLWKPVLPSAWRRRWGRASPSSSTRIRGHNLPVWPSPGVWHKPGFRSAGWAGTGA